jgi:hypothetical protein
MTDQLPGFCSRAPYTLPADDLARRLDGFRLDNAGRAALITLLIDRHGAEGARKIVWAMMEDLK